MKKTVKLVDGKTKEIDVVDRIDWFMENEIKDEAWNSNVNEKGEIQLKMNLGALKNALIKKVIKTDMDLKKISKESLEELFEFFRSQIGFSEVKK